MLFLFMRLLHLHVLLLLPHLQELPPLLLHRSLQLHISDADPFKRRLSSLTVLLLQLLQYIVLSLLLLLLLLSLLVLMLLLGVRQS
jgi:hypothetical protein